MNIVKKISYLSIMLLAALLTYYWFSTMGVPQGSRVAESTELSPVVSANLKPDQASFLQSDNAIKPTLLAPPELLKPADMEAVRAEFDYLDQHLLLDGREFIYFDTQQLQTFKEGKTFQILLSSTGNPYTGTVTGVTEFEGIRRLTGNFKELGEHEINQFSMTVSQTGGYAAANFSVGSESFTLEAKNGLGWINNIGNESAHLERFETELWAQQEHLE